MISPTPLLDQITPYLKKKYSRLPKKIKEIVSKIGLGKAYESGGCKLTRSIPIEQMQQSLGIKFPELPEDLKGRAFKISELPKELQEKVPQAELGEFPNLTISYEITRDASSTISSGPEYARHFYKWDRLSAFERELEVTIRDYENNPIPLTKLIEPHLKKKFDRLPKQIKIYVAIVDQHRLWDTLTIKERGRLVSQHDCKYDPANAQIIDDSCKLYQEKQGVEWQIDNLELLRVNTPLELESKNKQLKELYHRRDVEIPKRQAALSETKIKSESSDSERNLKTETLLASKLTPDTAENRDDWKEQARTIADEFFDRDTKAGCRDSLKGYSRRVMGLMQERDIKGTRGIINNSNYIMRDALQGAQWWQNKQK